VHDLLVENAIIIDGLGGPRRPGVVAVDGDRISAVAPPADAKKMSARRRVDAGGLVLAPGIIDIHTHYDAQLTWDSLATPSSSLGVTTVVIGNCGFTIAPCRPRDRELTMRHLTHVEGMALESLRAGIRWDFESYPEYLALLEKLGCVLNVASLFGHSSLRTYVMGEAACQRAARPDEVQEMKRLLAEGLRAGAIGFATSVLEQHNGEGGTPMPSRLADAQEFSALTGALGEAGRGVFMIQRGMNTKMAWLEELSAANGRPVMIAAELFDPNDPERVFREVSQIEAARSRGHELWAQVSCTPVCMDFTLRHPYPMEAILAWRPAMEAPDEQEYRRLLADPAFRSAIKAELETKGVPDRFSAKTWAKLFVVEVSRPEHAPWKGKNFEALALELGRHPLDVFLDFGLADELDTLFYVELFNNVDHEVAKLLNNPSAAIALSDAGAHLSFLCDAGFGLHLFGYWARQRGDMTLEQAVKRVTSDVAQCFRIPDRGRIQVGACADLILFDPETVGRGEKRTVQDLPAGGRRLDTPAVGLQGVWVNGVRILDQKGLVGDAGKPGRLLRDFTA
jgi:N-acyl-D-amino-acid deacylase